ncbi:hypothetical protein MES4922_130079 [Mesorhizobium ventifaucium]|uniref:Uncharacterized protein n=1 Tax=Mesorhizobium ventifaucium TaxID=666020 RepID=A0ABN8JEU4_9HYPH|nr:hypothetical protein MES4922_130079 [Mesorhizobium ventifaucium]
MRLAGVTFCAETAVPDSIAVARVTDINIIEMRSGDIHPFPHETEPCDYIGRLSDDAMAKASQERNWRLSQSGRKAR